MEDYILHNPLYGSGAYRRGIRLTNIGPGETLGELQDNIHAMRCLIRHDGGIVTALSPEFIRVPVDTCAGAAEPARELVGTRIDVPFRELFGGGRPLRHCSHMFDLFWLVVAQAGRQQERERFYEIHIPDQPDTEAQPVQLKRDGALLLDWRVLNGTILTPEPFAGRQVLKGLASWASEALDEETMQAVLILQKGFFVSRSRRYRLDLALGPLGEADERMRGSCWTYTSPRFEAGIRQNSLRDMSDADSLARFA